MNNLYKIIRYDTTEYAAAVALREELLRKPLGLRYTEEELLLEKDLVHLGIYGEGELIATAALAIQQKDCQLQRVAVKSERQSQGLGTKLLAFVDSEARASGASSIYCYARESAVQFYLKNKYILNHEVLIKFGLVHHRMSKDLEGVFEN